MLLKEAFDKYLENLESQNSTTISAYRGRVKKYLKLHHNQDIHKGLSKKQLEDFIFADNQKCQYKYNAMKNFYEYVYNDLLKNKERVFPINRSDVISLDKKREQTKVYKRGRKSAAVNFLPDNFDFKLLFDNTYYSHLNNDIATITIKAIIGLALSTGFDSQHFFKNKTNNYLRVTDVTVLNSDTIKIIHISENNSISEILISGEYYKYLLEYIEIRDKYIINSNLFFEKMWSGYDLNYDTNIEGRKPADVQTLVLYFLKYISNKLQIRQLKITDLRYNMVYQYLINTRGSALNEIIRMFGYPTFVQVSFERFIESINDTTYHSYDFFNKASSIKDEQDEIVDEAEVKTILTILERRLRDSRKVKKMKNMYNNECQICGKSITLLDYINYSEVHHIHPLGKDHLGVDEINNMIVLCPNHHKLFDLGIIAIDPINPSLILHIDDSNDLNNSKIKLKHSLSKTCIRYHYDKIFIPLRKTIEKNIKKN